MTQWSGQPAYQQVADTLRERIADHTFPVGSKLPSITDLMRQYDVSITVVRMALSQLRHEGLIDTHQGKGAFVRATQPTTDSSGQASPSPEFEAIMDQLDGVQQHLNQIDQRLDQLEKLARHQRQPDR